MTKTIEIWQKNEAWHTKTVSLGCCPFCGHAEELIVCEVERKDYAPADWPSAVQCGACGSSGPWGGTEERAVELWNAATATLTISTTGWHPVPIHDGSVDYEKFPF